MIIIRIFKDLWERCQLATVVKCLLHNHRAIQACVFQSDGAAPLVTPWILDGTESHCPHWLLTQSICTGGDYTPSLFWNGNVEDKHRALKQRLQLLAFSGSSPLFMHLKMPFQAVKDLGVKGQHFALVTEKNREQSLIFAEKDTQI